MDTGEVSRIFVRHLTSLLLPSNALLFLFTGPHAWYVSPLFILPVVVAFVLDDGPWEEKRQPRDVLPAWPFDALVYVLGAMQLLVIVGIARMFAVQDLFSVDMVVMITVVGGSSGFSIITAHELIHRPKAWERNFGRLLLCTVLQEHFFTEHLRGHHVRVGTPEDPATARFGEDYESFYKRTVPAQFKSAWALEKKRLGDADMSNLDPRMLRNRIVHGLVVGWGMAALVGLWAGLAAFAAFLLQAYFASRLLEAVNYFEHWGLMRTGRRPATEDSWDTHSWFTYYGLTGLSRHADHHYEQARPFQQLRIHPEAPMLPTGYVAMVDMVMTKNDQFQEQAVAELRRMQLGPFRDGAEPEPVEEAPARGWLAGWREVSPGIRIPVNAALFLLAVTLGSVWLGETPVAGAAAWGFGATLAWYGWILAAFVAMFQVLGRLEAQGWKPIASWPLALSLLVALGVVSERFVGLVG